MRGHEDRVASFDSPKHFGCLGFEFPHVGKLHEFLFCSCKCDQSVRSHSGEVKDAYGIMVIFRPMLRGGIMKAVILDVRSPSDAMNDFSQAWKSRKAQRSARISFTSPELLWKVLTAKRWELLKALCGVGPVSIRKAARRVHRDVKAVHGDVTALLSAGLLIRAQPGGVEFPFDAVKVEFLLHAA